MDYDSEISGLASETIVLQALLVGLMNSLKKRDPAMADAAREAFDYAEVILTAGSMKSGGAGHSARAMEVLETLRSTVF